MTPENKATWIEALRSGKYKQGAYALHQSDRFCCLGVAIEVLTDLEWEDCDDPFDFEDKKQVKGSQSLSCTPSLPDDVAEQLGFGDIVPWDVIRKFYLGVLPPIAWTWEGLATYLNDTRQFTFNEIADVMEKYL